MSSPVPGLITRLINELNQLSRADASALAAVAQAAVVAGTRSAEDIGKELAAGVAVLSPPITFAGTAFPELWNTLCLRGQDLAFCPDCWLPTRSGAEINPKRRLIAVASSVDGAAAAADLIAFVGRTVSVIKQPNDRATGRAIFTWQ